MSETVAISSGLLTARIAPLGAELRSLTDGSGAEWMTDGDPAFWTGHAPLLFPIVGSLAGDCYRLGGGTWSLPRHGFARRSVFELAERRADHARFRLSDSAETRAVYPFAFTLDMAFGVVGMTLEMAATVTNPGRETLPFSFGYHPAFAWPLPGGADKGAHTLAFAQDEPQPVRRVSRECGLVLPETEATPVRGRELALNEDLFRADAVIWDHLSSRALTYSAQGGGRLDIAFPDSPSLGLWQVPGARYLCIEPWQGHADPQGFSGDFRDKPGVVALEPGASRLFRMTVTVTPAERTSR
jgi:galactose mutarotase-like enzyme